MLQQCLIYTGSRGDVFVVRASKPSKTSEKTGYFDRVQEGLTRQRGCPMCRAIVTPHQSEAFDEQNFRKWRCYCFLCEHFELIFSRE